MPLRMRWQKGERFRVAIAAINALVLALLDQGDELHVTIR